MFLTRLLSGVDLRVQILDLVHLKILTQDTEHLDEPVGVPTLGRLPHEGRACSP